MGKKSDQDPCLLTYGHNYDYNKTMVTVNVAELKAKLSHYLKYPERGESVNVTSHGVVIAKIVPEHEEAPEVNWFQFFQENPPVSLSKKGPPTSELIRQIRDEDL